MVSAPARVEVGPAPLAEYAYVSEPWQVEGICKRLAGAKRLAYDSETTGLDPHIDTIRLAQFSDGDLVVVLDLKETGCDVLAPIFENVPWIVGHNIGFDLGMLLTKGVRLGRHSRVFDTMLAGQLLGCGTADGYLNRNNLKDSAARFLGADVDKGEQTSDWSGDLSERQLIYAARDAWTLIALAETQSAALKQAGLTKVAGIENGAVPFMAWLDVSGVRLDVDAWLAIEAGMLAELTELEGQMAAHFGNLGLDMFGDTFIDWGKFKDLKHRLASLGIGLEGTSLGDQALAKIAKRHPIGEQLRRWRSLAKMTQTYGKSWLADKRGVPFAHPVTGRYHPRYLQLGQPTGRTACSNPNVQQIPRDARYRACFVPEPGNKFAIADYDQLQLRIMSERAPDSRMIREFELGVDVHELTAKETLRLATVTRPQRQIAKSQNYGQIFGLGDEHLMDYAATEYGMEITKPEATKLRAAWFALWSGIAAHQKRIGRGKEATRTPAGRRRLDVEKFTTKLNTPVVGTEVDGAKTAMALLWEMHLLDKLGGAKPVLFVHDEIVLEAPADQAEQAAAMLEVCMVAGMESQLKRVPTVADSHVADCWSK